MSTVGRQIAVIFLVGGAFAVGLSLYLIKETRIPEGPKLVATSDERPRGPDTLEIAQRVASAFVAALAAGDLDGAYAQMARPYRAVSSPAAFRAAWKNAPLLAGARAVKLTRSRTESLQLPDGGFVPGATFTASGMLVVAAGALEASFTFLREDGDAHVLALFVGGVPIVQGIGK